MKLKKNKTVVLSALGIAVFGLAGIFAAFGWLRASLSMLCIGLCALIVMALIIHRVLVKVWRETKNPSQSKAIAGAIQHLNVNSQALNKTIQGLGPGVSGLNLANRDPKNSLSLGNCLPTTLFPGAIGPKFEFAERIYSVPNKFETFALRSKSIAIRDSYARAATGFNYDLEDILRILRTMRAGMLPNNTQAKTWDPKLLLTLARILANQRFTHNDIEDAETIFDAVVGLHKIAVLGKTDAYVYSEILQNLGAFRAAKKILKETRVSKRDPVHYELVCANELAFNENWEAWVSKLNDLYSSVGLLGVQLQQQIVHSPLDAILADSTNARTVDGSLVSIIVPTFEGARYIETTLRALTTQTWKNLEIIVVDDGSSEDNLVQLRSICQRYNDVRLIEQGRNLGAYPARNVALDVANGKYITVHDDDDWSHPQKIEIQASYLDSHKTCVGNMTRHARATENLDFTRINNNPSYSQPNFSSLMIRREVFDKVGVWDDVNRGADAEFRDRLVTMTGKTVEVLLEVPLSFTRTHGKSLTAGEIGRGYIDPSRLFYQSAYQAIHSANPAPKDIMGKILTMPKPLNMKPGNRGVDLGDFDVVFATDFTFPGGTSSLTLNEIEACAAEGLKVGMINMFSPVNAGSVVLTPRALEVAALDGVEVLSLADSARVHKLVIRHPSVLQFAENLRSNLTVDSVKVIVNNPPVLRGGKGYGFDFSTVIENSLALFGKTPEIIPESGVTAELAQKIGRRNEISERTWAGFVKNAEDRRLLDEIDFTRKPVLGRHSRDAALKWPNKLATYKDVYVSNTAYDVKIMGGVDSIPDEARKILRKGSKIYEFNEMPVNEFLSGLDFWCYFHSSELTESFGMAAVEAMQQGLVVILPEYMRANFGEAALYCEPGEVKSLVEKYWEDPELYKSQCRKAMDTADEAYSLKAFLKRIENA